MNSINKKLHTLEDNVLPELPERAAIYIKNEAEIELSRNAQAIRNMIPDVSKIWKNPNLTLQEKEEKTLAIYQELSPKQKIILSRDSAFMTRRLRDLVVWYFKTSFPVNSEKPFLRVEWFFTEMDKLAHAEHIIDSEWNHNRDEDNPDFDDFAWWNRVDLKIKELYPEGIFTSESWNKTREFYDKIQSEYMVQYWQNHPEEFEKLTKSLKAEVGYRKLSRNIFVETFQRNARTIKESFVQDNR
ncbi:MAG TPA: hypothetical protein VMX17_00910 [Candidatus Glassbacteria bacterium]|nr:hypothetical protein [Candidatus Glassbacteria bacterium]